MEDLPILNISNIPAPILNSSKWIAQMKYEIDRISREGKYPIVGELHV